MTMQIEFNIDAKNGQLIARCDLYDVVDCLEPDEKKELANALTWDVILECAAERLAGNTDAWACSDNAVAMNFLARVENHLLSDYKWNMLQNLERLARDICTHEHLYWRMWDDPVQGNFFQKWLRDNNIESNHTSEYKTYQEFKDYVESTLESFAHKDLGDD